MVYYPGEDITEIMEFFHKPFDYFINEAEMRPLQRKQHIIVAEDAGPYTGEDPGRNKTILELQKKLQHADEELLKTRAKYKQLEKNYNELRLDYQQTIVHKL
jgi:hypothetical protein